MSETADLVDEQNTAWAEWLWRRGEQPGVVRLARARDTAVRLTHLNTPPLSDEVARRYAAVMALQAQLPPIVYAEPLPAAPESVTAVPAPKRPLPIVTAQPTAVPASPPPTILPETPAPIPVRQASTVVPAVTPSSPATPTSRQTPVMSLPPLPDPLPVVRPAAQPTRQAQPGRQPTIQPVKTERDTAVPIPPPAILMPEPEKRERPSATSISPDLPVVGAAATPPAVLVRDVPQPITSAPPVVTPVRVLPSEVNGTSNGRAATPLPLVQAQPTAVTPPLPTPLTPPLPLAQPMGGTMAGVVQRAAMDTAVPPSTAKPQPTPTPNRVVQTNSVIQRVKGEGETAHTQADDGGETTDTQIDMDELVEKVHRRFLRKLAVEGERRGKTIWP